MALAQNYWAREVVVAVSEARFRDDDEHRGYSERMWPPCAWGILLLYAVLPLTRYHKDFQRVQGPLPSSGALGFNKSWQNINNRSFRSTIYF